jgi:hypothetical protein
VRSAGHAPSPRAWSPVLELACLPGFLASHGDVAPVGLTRGPRVVSRTRCRNIQALRLRGVHTAAHPDARKRRKFPSQVWALLHSFTDSTLHGRAHRDASRPCSVRGSFPFSVLPVAGSHLDPAGSQPAGSVASSGFRTLSTLCSPHDLPGLFHPGSAPGVSLRGLFPTRRRTLSRTPDPSGFWRGSSRTPASPSGIDTPCRSCPQARGLAG